MAEAIAAGRHVLLRPLLPDDYESVFWMEHASRQRIVSYRNRGESVPLEQYGQLLWTSTLCQFVACRPDGSLVGLVVCYEPNFRNGTAKLALLCAAEPEGLDSAMAEAVEIFVAYVFETFDLRKLHADCLESNLGPMRSAVGTVFEVEACFKGREFVDGAYEDLLVLTLTREAWIAWCRRTRASDVLLDEVDLSSFLVAVSQVTGVDVDRLAERTPLVDLELDSLLMLELVELVEGPERLPDDALAACVDLGDCYRLFEAVRSRSVATAAMSGG